MDNQIRSPFIDIDNLFVNNQINAISEQPKGFRYLLIRSMNRNKICKDLLTKYGIEYNQKEKDLTEDIFNSAISTDSILSFVKEYSKSNRLGTEERIYLEDQLSRLKYFDWGGTYQNALEKTIVNNFVKQYKSYDEINKLIESSILDSVRGYTLSSWYNHWSTILLEDLFSDIPEITPAVGKVQKIDFFINKIPFDLKVTYFPDEFMEQELKRKNFGVELTMIKKTCRLCNISIPDDLKGKKLKEHLYNKLTESTNPDAQYFVQHLKSLKREIIKECKDDPKILKTWLYENQGEKRFDASNRFFIVLIDQQNMYDSWKLKRNINLIKSSLEKKVKNYSENIKNLKLSFYWKQDHKTYEVISDMLFISK